MITIESAESALKNIYLDVVINDINTKTNPFLTMIGKNTKTVAGKDARATIRYGNAGSVGARAEDGNLPVASGNKIAEICVPLKNLYGTFQISDKAIKASQNNAGAFASLLSGEMQNLISTAQADLNRMIYGNGNPYLAYATTMNVTGKTFTVPLRFVNNFKVGDIVDLCGPQDTYGTNYVITSVDKETGIIGYNGTLSVPPKGDRFYIYPSAKSNIELNGIDSIFNKDGMYNLDPSEHAGIAPCLVKDSEIAVRPLDEEQLMEFMDAYEEHCQGNPADILLTHPIVRKSLFETLKDFRTNVDVTEMAGGFRGFSFNGIPMYSDLKCKAGTLYALNSDSWAMHQLCDWTWISGDDGSILKQIDGKPAYSATLVKYADLICDKPFIQGKVTDYSAVMYKQA